VIYLDSSVALAHLFAEDHIPAASFWQESLTSCRLLEYEMWNRVHARGRGRSHGDAVRELLGRINLVELVPPVLERALEPFPLPVRTLDGLHLAAIEFLRRTRQDVQLATYDVRLADAARALGIPMFPL
jgi:predicted nucleic acid-binding protein